VRQSIVGDRLSSAYRKIHLDPQCHQASRPRVLSGSAGNIVFKLESFKAEVGNRLGTDDLLAGISAACGVHTTSQQCQRQKAERRNRRTFWRLRLDITTTIARSQKPKCRRFFPRRGHVPSRGNCHRHRGPLDEVQIEPQIDSRLKKLSTASRVR
jgi:hypothetical protein